MLSMAPRIWMRLSATMTRVRVDFSMFSRVLPLLPAMRPIARAKWSPWGEGEEGEGEEGEGEEGWREGGRRREKEG